MKHYKQSFRALREDESVATTGIGRVCKETGYQQRKLPALELRCFAYVVSTSCFASFHSDIGRKERHQQTDLNAMYRL